MPNRSRRKSATRTVVVGEIPDKMYFRIGEVAAIVGVKPYVLRYWETEFPSLKPQKSRTRQRMYRRRDVELLLKIKHLLYDRKYTIAGARQLLKKGVALADIAKLEDNGMSPEAVAGSDTDVADTTADAYTSEHQAQQSPVPHQAEQPLQHIQPQSAGQADTQTLPGQAVAESTKAEPAVSGSELLQSTVSLPEQSLLNTDVQSGDLLSNAGLHTRADLASTDLNEELTRQLPLDLKVSFSVRDELRRGLEELLHLCDDSEASDENPLASSSSEPTEESTVTTKRPLQES